MGDGAQMQFERIGDLELAATRLFEAPAPAVFAAWTQPDLMMRWWAPKSMGVPLRACEMDVKPGGQYRLEFGQDAENSMAFVGRYLEAEPPHCLVWTNEETGDGAVTTVTFEDREGRTRLVFHERYPTREARDEACAGMEGGMAEQFAQLDDLLRG
jgi:uncharacterized protein YndB with AHSA1/START domain